MESTYVKWIREGLAQPGKTQAGLAKALGVAQPAVSRLLKGDRRLRADEIPLIATYLGTPSPIGEVREIRSPMETIPVLGEVAAGVWLESTATNEAFAPVPVVPDSRFPIEHQFGLVVRGTSINKFASDGDILHCVSIPGTAIEPVAGDLVIVERRRYQGSLIETTAKILQKNGQFELWPYSTDPQHQDPIIVADDDDFSDEEISVIAVVLTAHKKWVRPE